MAGQIFYWELKSSSSCKTGISPMASLRSDVLGVESHLPLRMLRCPKAAGTPAPCSRRLSLYSQCAASCADMEQVKVWGKTAETLVPVVMQTWRLLNAPLARALFWSPFSPH